MFLTRLLKRYLNYGKTTKTCMNKVLVTQMENSLMPSGTHLRYIRRNQITNFQTHTSNTSTIWSHDLSHTTAVQHCTECEVWKFKYLFSMYDKYLKFFISSSEWYQFQTGGFLIKRTSMMSWVLLGWKLRVGRCHLLTYHLAFKRCSHNFQQMAKNSTGPRDLSQLIHIVNELKAIVIVSRKHKP